MKRETLVPAIPDVRSDNLLEVIKAIKSTLDVREARIGDPLDQLVTVRDLTDFNVLSLGGITTLTNGAQVPVTNPAINPDGYDPTADTTTPPQPTGLTAAATFSNVYLSWNGAPYRNHAYTEIWRSDTDILGNAVMIGTTVSNVYADAAREAHVYYYWIRFVSQADVTGPYNATNGTVATTGQDPAAILAVLQGQITQSQLYSSLSSRIDLIDAPANVAGSVNARVAVVQSQVNDLLNTPAYNNSTAYAAGVTVTYNGSLYQSLQATTGHFPTETAYWKKIGDYASLGDAVAAHTTQIGNLQTGLASEVTARSLLATQFRGDYTGTDLSQLTSGLLYEERVARSTGDSSLATSISSLSTTVTNNYTTLNSAITSEQTARSTADATMASSIYSLQSTASGMDIIKSWNFDSTTESFAGVNATISWSAGSLRINSSNGDPMLYTPTLNIDGSKGYLVRMRIKRLAGSAWDGKIYYNTAGHGESETYKVQIADGTVTNEWRILEWDMSALSDWTSSTIINCRIDLGGSAADQFLIDWISISRVAPMPLASQATLQNDYYTKTATDSAIASATQSLVSTTALNNALASYATTATLTNSYYTKTQTDSAISSATSTLVSTTAMTNALNNALADYTTTALLQQNYYTKTDTNSAISSANSTLSASIAGTYATTVSVQQNYYAKASGQGLEAQYTVKIDNNGYVSGFGLASTVVNGEPSSLFLVNADRFAIANPSAGRVGISSIGLDFNGNIINTSATHSFVVGDTVSFQNVSGYSGKYTVTAVYSSTQFRIGTFSYSATVSSSSYVSKATVPFIVQDGKVYIDTVVIKEASITSAMIGTLTADKITTGTLTAAINVNTGLIYGGVNPSGATPGSAGFGTGYMLGAYGGANQFFIGSPTQNLYWNGSNLTVKGVIYASAGSFSGSIYAGDGTIGGNTIDATGIQSPNYVSGSAGWRIYTSGAEFNNLAIRGQINGGSFTGFAWPSSGSGFHLGPYGLLLGNANTTGYFQVNSSDGSLYAPRMSIVNGTLTLGNNQLIARSDGTLTVDSADIARRIVLQTGTCDPTNVVWGTYDGTPDGLTIPPGGENAVFKGKIKQIILTNVYDADTLSATKNQPYYVSAAFTGSAFRDWSGANGSTFRTQVMARCSVVRTYSNAGSYPDNYRVAIELDYTIELISGYFYSFRLPTITWVLFKL